MQAFERKLIGSGTFTKCYQISESRVSLVTVDPIKDLYSMGWLDNDLFPVMERVDCGVYEMDYLPRDSSLKGALDTDQWIIYKTLREIAKANVRITNPYDGYTVLHKAFEQIANERLRETMLSALNQVANYSSEIGFEVSPRNVTHKGGKLILLDVFFCKQSLKQIRTG